MLELSQAQTKEIQEVGRKLAEWRANYGRPTPIPAELWSRAIALAAHLGASTVARELHLSPTLLRRKMKESREIFPVENAGAAFVELLASVGNTITECEIEVEGSRSGTKVSLRLRNVAPVELGVLLRELVS